MPSPGAPRSRRWQPTLAGTFLGLTVTTFVTVGVLLVAFLAASRRSILDTADALRHAAAQRVESAVSQDLGVAGRCAQSLEREVRLGALDLDDAAGLERALQARLLDEPALAEVAVTRASALGYDAQGAAVLAPDAPASPRWELAVYRTAAPARVVARRTERRAGLWSARLVERDVDDPSGQGTPRDAGAAPDPTERATFVEAAARAQGGRPLWSDLHWSEVDPAQTRRVVMTVQQAVFDHLGRFAGVVRVGLLTDAIDRVARIRVDEGAVADPHRVFICDAKGRLLVRPRPGSSEPVALSGDDLRFASTSAPPEMAAALALPEVARVAVGQDTNAAFDFGGLRYLVTFRGLADTQDWIVGILVPEDHYTAGLREVRDRFLALYVVVAVLAVGGGFLASTAVRRGLRRVDDVTARMQAFEFDRAPTRAAFRDVEVVLDSLERAKTAMRALGKYAPLDLVKELARENLEPTLGGHPADLSVMFCDIQGFTTLAEDASPNELADLLGAYLEAMTGAIRSTGGTIDKFIGDAVMALWNAPAPVPDHPRRACEAVLACRRATQDLYASPRWRGRPALVTRFGIHTDRVLVGHFGAPERMNYTALGDGVNLASRLEGLGKQYGVTALVSEAVVLAAGDAFAFRRLDKVAVKGKSSAVVVHELLGPAGPGRPPPVVAYEEALDAYFARRFADAAERLAPHAGGDAPSRLLLERCRRLIASPPGESWDGVYSATTK